MVYRTCKPFNALRKILMWACVIGFTFCVVFLHTLFTLNLHRSTGAWLVLTVFCLLAFEVSLSANVLVDCVNKAVHWLKKKLRIVTEMPK